MEWAECRERKKHFLTYAGAQTYVYPLREQKAFDFEPFISFHISTFSRFCLFQETTSYLKCLKHGSLELFDRMTSVDVIPLTQHLRLTRHRENDIDNDEMNEVKRTTSKR